MAWPPWEYDPTDYSNYPMRTVKYLIIGIVCIILLHYFFTPIYYRIRYYTICGDAEDLDACIGYVNDIDAKDEILELYAENKPGKAYLKWMVWNKNYPDHPMEITPEDILVKKRERIQRAIGAKRYVLEKMKKFGYSAENSPVVRMTEEMTPEEFLEHAERIKEFGESW